MKLKHTLITLTMIVFLSSLTACSSNQTKPTSNIENTQESVKVATTETTTSELPQPTVANPSRGPSQSTGARLGIYIVKVAVSAAVSFFATKAILDYVKKDLTGEN